MVKPQKDRAGTLADQSNCALLEYIFKHFTVFNSTMNVHQMHQNIYAVFRKLN